MSGADMNEARSKWDAVYGGDKGVPGRPSRVLAENQHLLPDRGEALELACGLGGNAVLLAERGLATRAWDISGVAMARLADYARARGLPLECEARDVVANPPAPDACDVIVVAHFLDRSLIPPLIRALRPGGLVFYQSFTLTRVTDTGPSNPEFRLADNELLALFAGLRVLVYREEGRTGDIARGFRDEAMIVARKAG
jgi:SAM-dependent methyltransferase